MSKVWIFGGSFCGGVYRGNGDRDWTSQLNAEVFNWSCTPNHVLAQMLFLEHAVDTHYTPNLVIWDILPHNRWVYINQQDREPVLSEYSNWITQSRIQDAHQHCGCFKHKTQSQFAEQYWKVFHYNNITDWPERTIRQSQFKKYTQRRLLDPLAQKQDLQQTMEITKKCLGLLEDLNIPTVMICPNMENILASSEAEQLMIEHGDKYINMNTLAGTQDHTNYNEESPNHLTLEQNIQWADFFNKNYLGTQTDIFHNRSFLDK